MITNHGFLENPTFRGMRFHLLESFDSIYVLDLHGNTTKGESSPNNIRDSNVFDIQQGVSVAIMVRTSDKARQRKRGADNKIPPARLRHAELWGSRSEKSEALHNGILAGGPWADLTPSSPYYFFVPKDLALQDQYGAGFSITDLMPEKVTGVITARDRLALDFDDVAQAKKLRRFADTTRSDAEVRTEFFKDKTSPKSGDTRGWNMSEARKTLAKLDPRTLLRSIAYRPFDQRSIAYTPLLVDWGREAFMRHLLERPNLALVTCRQGVGATWDNAFVANTLGDDSYVSNRSRERGYYFPLYLIGSGDLLASKGAANLDPKLYAAICKIAEINPKDQAGPDDDFRATTGVGRPSEVKVFDYIYGVLHSPDYRETYAEFLKIDFPRIPYPASPEVFAHISGKGEQLRRLHLMEAAAIGDTPYVFDGEGDDVVAKAYPKFDDGRVWINPDQSFADVPEGAWTFHIGGYQPAQKWLKDRRGRTLSWDDIGHYQKIIKILIETDRIMGEIELPIERAA